VQPANDTKEARAFWGMQRTLVSEPGEGVTDGFTKKLLITGVGYRAAAQGRKLKLQLGYSHDVDLEVPEGLDVEDARSDDRRSSRASTSRRLASSPPKSAAGASPNPTRARVSSTRASTSSARKGRRSNMAKLSLFERRRQRVRTALKSRAGRQAAAVRAPHRQAHLRADHR
jgi:hypothetical protein